MANSLENIIAEIESRSIKTGMTFRLKYFPFNSGAYWLGHYRSEGGAFVSNAVREEKLIDCLSGVIADEEVRANPIRSAEVVSIMSGTADFLVNESDNEAYKRFGEHLGKCTEILREISNRSDKASDLIENLLQNNSKDAKCHQST